MTYVKNDRTHSAVVLVGINDTGGIISPSTLYGYLDGYALPKPTSLFAPLKRPLLGPDRATYGIDVAARRLVRVSAPLPGRRAWDPFDSLPAKGCSSWPGAHATYLACPTSVIRIARDGSRALVFEDRNCDSFCRSQGDWGPVLSSPDGRTLLAEHNLSPCGVGVTSYFVPARGGVPTPVLPATDFADSAGIGWVDASHALVASSGFADCGDVAHGAIYLVNRNEPAPWNSELVVHTNGYDATLWGS